MTKKKTKVFCKGISDKDFIYEIFSDKGFVADAGSFFHSENTRNSDGEISNSLSDSNNEDSCSSCL
ncbi:hypothetical protein [Carboxylicivirga linearis]|uniref:Uncharacterized protein n=1 Tax=Carboxylicivirga linearis TaxID=1628157 RepID=A0ABS5JQH3_9BACT|nr:hypothetical protein [Carboxylicivirga linearis]MBS2097117.1 hypothetical protein [Carboxylicivirga linearis]